MTTYWAILSIPILASLTPIKIKGILVSITWQLYALILILFIGLRHETGGDWANYLILQDSIKEIDLSQLVTLNTITDDLAYQIINWYSVHYYYGIYTTNLVCAIIFVIGLFRLCRSLPLPWIALAVATPYLIIVVAVGYTRQAAATGIFMWALVDLMSGKNTKYFILILIGALFHKTMLVMLPFGFLFKSSILDLRTWFIFIASLFLFIFFENRFDQMIQNFFSTNPLSKGAQVRLSVNVVAALVFLTFRHKWQRQFGDANLWFMFSIIILVMLIASLIFSEAITSMIDRLALYFMIIQLVVFARVPQLIKNHFTRSIFLISVVACYVLELFVWLNVGWFSRHWIPYNNIIFEIFK